MEMVRVSAQLATNAWRGAVALGWSGSLGSLLSGVGTGLLCIPSRLCSASQATATAAGCAAAGTHSTTSPRCQHSPSHRPCGGGAARHAPPTLPSAKRSSGLAAANLMACCRAGLQTFRPPPPPWQHCSKSVDKVLNEVGPGNLIPTEAGLQELQLCQWNGSPRARPSRPAGKVIDGAWRPGDSSTAPCRVPGLEL